MIYALVISHQDDFMLNPPFVYGPFDTVLDAQNEAEMYRSLVKGISHLVEATPENNEAWTELGWYFAIIPMSRV